jgi:hypothetical protein
MMNVDQSVEWELAGKTEVLGENMHLCHFAHHKSHMTRPGLEQGHRCGKPATNRLSYSAALCPFKYGIYSIKVERGLTNWATTVMWT